MRHGTDSSSAPSSSRRGRLASFEAARRAEQRRRAVGLFAICGVLALALLVYPIYLFVDDYRARNAGITDFGPPAAAAACDQVATEPATGNLEHIAEGTKVTYDRFPPDSGPHYATPAPFTKHSYTTADRPAVETLVHNLEHGYTVVWYRAEAPADQVDTLADIAKTFGSDDYDPADKFIAAPWSEADGGPFPADGKDVVLTRWTADPGDPGNQDRQQGVRQACGQISGAAIADFMAQYPVANSPSLLPRRRCRGAEVRCTDLGFSIVAFLRREPSLQGCRRAGTEGVVALERGWSVAANVHCADAGTLGIPRPRAAA